MKTRNAMKSMTFLLALLAALALMASAACSQKPPAEGDQDSTAQSATPDSGANGAPAAQPSGSTGGTGGGGTHQSSGPKTPSGNTSPGSSAPAPAPAPAEIASVLVTIPEGKNITVTLDTGLSTKTSTVGDPIAATVKKDVQTRQHPQPIIPAGSVVTGQIVEVQKAKELKGQAKLVVRFDTIKLPSGKTLNMVASLGSQGADTTKRSVGGIAGGAAAGAILGRIIGKDTKGAVIGAVAGGAIGTGVVLGMNNKDIELPAGTDIVLNVDQPLEVPVQKKDV